MARPDPSRRWTALGLLTLLLLTGCATLRRVRYEVQEPPKVRLAGVERLAVLDFANPLHYPDHDIRLGALVADRLAADRFYAVVRPETVRPVLAPLRLTPSHFKDPVVVREAGRLVGADALCFGDLQTLQVSTSERTREEELRVGGREEPSVLSDPDGNTRTVVLVMGIYRRLRITTFRWVLEARIEARIVRSSDAAVLWQRPAVRTLDHTAESSETLGEVERLERVRIAAGPSASNPGPEFRTDVGRALSSQRPTWSPREEDVVKVLTEAVDDLVADLRPRRVLRERRLAEADGDDEYAQRIREGNRAAAYGNWGEAATAWLRAVSLAPDRPEARAALGVLRERSGDLVQAREDYRRAAELLGLPWSQYLADLERMLGPR